MAVYDCFPFRNELDLLDLRLHELDKVVDTFVLVEATRTFTGIPKPLYYDENKERFAEFSHKIIHIIVDDMPMTRTELANSLSGDDMRWIASKYQEGEHWIRDRYQRNQIMQGLVVASPDDIIVISDADEIVRSSILENIEDTICDGSNAVHQYLNSYYLNVTCTNMPWWGSKIIRKKFIWTPCEVRFHTPPCRFIEDGGWHYNYFGGAENILVKIQSFAHSEFNIPEVANMNSIQDRLNRRVDVLGRLYEYAVIDMDEHNTPKYVLENLDKFEKYIYRGDK
jgi:beta-1,4-mannosyl-glycoprotein beta-1,4-N-acetylglucosaminyltransferase